VTDHWDRLERRLSRLRPRELSDDLVCAIDRDLEAPQPSPRADRLLWCAIGSGALAACVIVGILIVQTNAGSPAPLALTKTDVPRLGSFADAIARADAGTDDLAR
jgi:hypothetical protein